MFPRVRIPGRRSIVMFLRSFRFACTGHSVRLQDKAPQGGKTGSEKKNTASYSSLIRKRRPCRVLPPQGRPAVHDCFIAFGNCSALIKVAALAESLVHQTMSLQTSSYDVLPPAVTQENSGFSVHQGSSGSGMKTSFPFSSFTVPYVFVTGSPYP